MEPAELREPEVGLANALGVGQLLRFDGGRHVDLAPPSELRAEAPLLSARGRRRVDANGSAEVVHGREAHAQGRCPRARHVPREKVRVAPAVAPPAGVARVDPAHRLHRVRGNVARHEPKGIGWLKRRVPMRQDAVARPRTDSTRVMHVGASHEDLIEASTEYALLPVFDEIPHQSMAAPPVSDASRVPTKLPLISRRIDVWPNAAQDG